MPTALADLELVVEIPLGPVTPNVTIPLTDLTTGDTVANLTCKDDFFTLLNHEVLAALRSYYPSTTDTEWPRLTHVLSEGSYQVRLTTGVKWLRPAQQPTSQLRRFVGPIIQADLHPQHPRPCGTPFQSSRLV